jgi:hypothetical protein
MTTHAEKRLKICKKCSSYTVKNDSGFLMMWCVKFDSPCNWEHHPLGKCYDANWFKPIKRWWEFWK